LTASWIKGIDIEEEEEEDIYTVSQKRDPNIIDCNFKRDWRILTIFGTNIPETAGNQSNGYSISHLT